MEIIIKAPELVGAIDTLSNVMDRLMKQIVALEEQGPCPSQIVDAPAETITPEQAEAIPVLPGKGNVVSLEEVKAKLGPVIAAGKQDQVKAIILKFGAKKVSEVPAEKYGELLDAVAKIS